MKNPIPKEKMMIIAQLEGTNEFLAINADEGVHDLTKATHWNGTEWEGYIWIGSWLKFTYNRAWISREMSLEQAGLEYPEELEGEEHAPQ